MKLSARTDIGLARAENQDNYSSGYLPGDTVWGIVCDGMGGGQNGRLASAIAAEIIEEDMAEALENDIPDEEMRDMMVRVVNRANREVYSRSGDGQLMMGTTVVCAVIRGEDLYLAHAGDSRAYLYTDEHLTLVTHDHSMVQEMIDMGRITPSQASHHPDKNVITRALGVEQQLEVDFSKRHMPKGATLLMCTDGLTNMVSDIRMESIIKKTDFYALADALVDEALMAGGGDNITVLLIHREEANKNGGR